MVTGLEVAPERQNVASEVLEQARSLNVMATDLAAAVEQRLDPVMMRVDEKVKIETACPQRNYPELFDRLREQHQYVEAALIRIREYLDRCEI